VNPSARRRLRDLELGKVRARVEDDPGAHPLRVARLRADLTTRELAELTDISPGTLGCIERRVAWVAFHT